MAGHIVGIEILNHPASFRYPTYWHVRTYGLFVANPFGSNAFSGGRDGKHTLPAGQSLSLHYRMILHQGDEKDARLSAKFTKYASEKR